jgi:hypothetical protein
MNNHFDANKIIDFTPFIPTYMKDEQVLDFLTVFEDFLNNMYEVAAEQNCTNKFRKATPRDIYEDSDTSPVLYKYGVVQPDGQVPSDPDKVSWTYNENYPTAAELDPGPAYPDLSQRP